MLRRPPSSTRTDTLFPYTTLFRSGGGGRPEGRAIAKAPAWHKRSALLLRRPEKRGYACTAIRQVGSGRYCCKLPASGDRLFDRPHPPRSGIEIGRAHV